MTTETPPHGLTLVDTISSLSPPFPHPRPDSWISTGQQYKDVPECVSNELLRRLALPASALGVLLDKNASITELLAYKCSTDSVNSALFAIKDLPSLFSRSKSAVSDDESTLRLLLQCKIPSRDVINKLNAAAGQAMLDGCLSLWHPSYHWGPKTVTPNPFSHQLLPFSIITFWYEALNIIDAKMRWSAAIAWLSHQKQIPTTIRSTFHALLPRTPWNNLQSAGFTGTEMKWMPEFLSKEMLTTTHIDTMLYYSQFQLERKLADDSGAAIEAPIFIELTDFGQSLLQFAESPGFSKQPYSQVANATLQAIGRKFERIEGEFTIWTVVYAPPIHFSAMRIYRDAKGQVSIDWPDSLAHQGRKMPNKLVKALKIWILEHKISLTSLIFNEKNKTLTCAKQTDSYSCAVVSTNTIRHYLFNEPLWSSTIRETMRLEYLIKIMDTVSKAQMAASGPNVPDARNSVILLPQRQDENEPPSPRPVESNLLASKTQAEDRLSFKRKADSLEDGFESESAMPIVGPTRTSVVTPIVKPEDVPETIWNPAITLPLRPVMKKPRIIQTTLSSASMKPKPEKLSRAAEYKRKARERVTNGTFTVNPTNWKKYKERLAVVDGGFSVVEPEHWNGEVRHVLEVRHSGCGRFLTMSEPYNLSNFKDHIKRCKESSGSMGQLSLTGSLVWKGSLGQPTELVSKTQQQKPETWPCPGLTKKTNARIEQYLFRTESGSGGGESVLTLSKKIYGRDHKMLNDEEKDRVRRHQLTTHRWRNSHTEGKVFAMDCLKSVTNTAPCVNCLAVLQIREFLNAIKREPPPDKNRVFTPHQHLNMGIQKVQAARNQIEILFENSKDGNVLRLYARQYAQGAYSKDKKIFTGLLDAVVMRTERELSGKGLQNMQYSAAYDEWCFELSCIRPEAFRAFCSSFAGRSERSFRDVASRATTPGFQQGFSTATASRVTQYLKDYNYQGPLATGVDDSKLLPAFRPFFDRQQNRWFIVGGTGQPLEVSDINALEEQLALASSTKASKLRLWVLTIPFPHIPPLILAASPISSKTSAPELAAMEIELLNVLFESNPALPIVSLGSDGTSVEREARRHLIESGFASVSEERIAHPDASQAPIFIQMIQVGRIRMVFVQDPKHCKKTLRNNGFSGARILTFGKYTICYENFRQMAFDPKYSPLYRRDVEKLDRQDDRAAARLFSAATLEYVNSEPTLNVGMASFLFVFGELVDAYQSRSLGHSARVRMVLRAKFFMDIWRRFLHEAGYPLSRHFISSEAADIVEIVINGFMGLVYIHRDDYNGKPLLPWLHGTETNEHIFGLLRSCVPDFTMLDVLRLIPKIAVRLATSSKSAPKSASDLRKTASGYAHTYTDSESANLHLLSIFPTDTDIVDLARLAYEDAVILWNELGYTPSASTVLVPTDIDEEDEDDGDEPEGEDEAEEGAALESAFDEASRLEAASGSPLSSTSEELNQCAFAAACLQLDGIREIECLPSLDPLSLLDLSKKLQNSLSSLASTTPEISAAISEALLSAKIPLNFLLQDQDQNMKDGNNEQGKASTALNLKPLVVERYKNQSREATLSVRPRLGRLSTSAAQDELDNLGEAGTKPEESSRLLLTKKIHEILRNEKELGTSTGLNRRTRWGNAPGATASLDLDANTVPVTGNAANAQLAVRSGANEILGKRRKAFANLTLSPDLTTAKIDSLSRMSTNSYGLAVVDGEVVLCQVVTLYQRGGGKVAKHSWTFAADHIGSVSYIAIQAWQHIRNGKFATYWGRTGKLLVPRYHHLPALAFLHLLPTKHVKVENDGAYMQISVEAFRGVVYKLLEEQDRVVAAVKMLTSRTKATKDAGVD